MADIDFFRYYLARYEAFCGLRARERSLDDFLSDFKFETLAAQQFADCALQCTVSKCLQP